MIGNIAEENGYALFDANLATKTEIEKVKSDLLKRIFGAMIAPGGLIVALVKLL